MSDIPFKHLPTDHARMFIEFDASLKAIRGLNEVMQTTLATSQIPLALQSTGTVSSVLDQLKNLPDLTAQWGGLFDRVDVIAKALPGKAFGELAGITEAVRVLKPQFSTIDPAIFSGFARIAESVRLSMPQFPAIDPAVFGGAWNDKVAGAYERLRLRAEELANNREAGFEDVEAFVAQAEAVNAVAPEEARSGVRHYVLLVVFWLLSNALQDPAKELMHRAFAGLLLVLMLISPPLPPKILAVPPLPSSDIAIAHDWQVEGLPAVIRRAGPKAEQRTLAFFTVEIRNPNTRQAYAHAVMQFFEWCDDRNLELKEITPFGVAAYVEEMQREYAAATVKQHLAAIRMLFDSLVAGQVLPMNPAKSVRGPRHLVNEGSTPVLSFKEASALIGGMDVSTVLGLRDRSILAVMTYAFARVGAAVRLSGEDYYLQKKRWWLRLHEKNGKVNEMPCHPKLEEYLGAYIDAAGIGDGKKPLFRSAIGKTKTLSDRPMHRTDVWDMVRRRVFDAGIDAAIGCHTFRATGLRDYLANGGRIEVAQKMAGHSNAKTTGFYDRQHDT